MKKEVRTAYLAEMAKARQARDAGDLDAAFAALERAHILGQRFLLTHISTHWQMLLIGLQRKDAKEVAGQVLRLITTVPGFLFGWIPKGNTGGANVSAIKPMAIPDDLQPYLSDFHVWRDVAARALILAAAALALVAGVAWADMRRGTEAAQLDQAWKQTSAVRVTDFGSTESLEVIPLVNWKAESGALRTEAGVSYLVKTDKNTILFDVGFNREQQSPSPLEHNMAALGIQRESIDSIFISHAHRDHLGGTDREKARSFSIGMEQKDLGATKVFAPVPLSYPNLEVQTVPQASALLPGVASTGPIPRRLLLGRIDEQALIIHVKGRGLVAIVGCGHQTIPKLVQHIRATFTEPLIGIIGDVHFPMPQGRLYVAGIDAQRWLASGDGIWNPISREQIESELALMKDQLQVLALGSHDTSDEALQMASRAFGDRFQAVSVGKSIRLQGP
jgi:metal-dependent hydrolase (beta-lactamase superfamily II)